MKILDGAKIITAINSSDVKAGEPVKLDGIVPAVEQVRTPDGKVLSERIVAVRVVKPA